MILRNHALMHTLVLHPPGENEDGSVELQGIRSHGRQADTVAAEGAAGGIELGTPPAAGETPAEERQAQATQWDTLSVCLLSTAQGTPTQRDHQNYGALVREGSGLQDMSLAGTEVARLDGRGCVPTCWNT